MTRRATFTLFGVVSGVLSAAAGFIPLGKVSIEIFGFCVGLRLFNDCSTDLSVYLFPGLIFGVAIGFYLYRLGLLSTARFAMFIVAAVVGNTIAVVLAMPLFEWLLDPLGLASIAVAGVVAGAVGGGVLARLAAWLLRFDRWLLLTAVAAALGASLILFLLSPWNFPIGTVLFYALWQAGYARMLAFVLARHLGPHAPAAPG